MKLKRILSIMLASVMVFAIMAVNTLAATSSSYIHVVNEHDTSTRSGYDFYSFSGYNDTDAFIYSFITAYNNTGETIQSRAGLIVYYADGTSDISQYTSNTKVVTMTNDGVQAYAEVYYDAGKVANSFFFRHNYYIDGVSVGNKSYTCDYGINNF